MAPASRQAALPSTSLTPHLPTDLYLCKVLRLIIPKSPTDIRNLAPRLVYIHIRWHV